MCTQANKQNSTAIVNSPLGWSGTTGTIKGEVGPRLVNLSLRSVFAPANNRLKTNFPIALIYDYHQLASVAEPSVIQLGYGTSLVGIRLDSGGVAFFFLTRPGTWKTFTKLLWYSICFASVASWTTEVSEWGGSGSWFDGLINLNKKYLYILQFWLFFGRVAVNTIAWSAQCWKKHNTGSIQLPDGQFRRPFGILCSFQCFLWFPPVWVESCSDSADVVFDCN